MKAPHVNGVNAASHRATACFFGLLSVLTTPLARFVERHSRGHRAEGGVLALLQLLQVASELRASVSPSVMAAVRKVLGVQRQVLYEGSVSEDAIMSAIPAVQVLLEAVDAQGDAMREARTLCQLHGVQVDTTNDKTQPAIRGRAVTEVPPCDVKAHMTLEASQRERQVLLRTIELLTQAQFEAPTKAQRDAFMALRRELYRHLQNDRGATATSVTSARHDAAISVRGSDLVVPVQEEAVACADLTFAAGEFGDGVGDEYALFPVLLNDAHDTMKSDENADSDSNPAGPIPQAAEEGNGPGTDGSSLETQGSLDTPDAVADDDVREPLPMDVEMSPTTSEIHDDESTQSISSGEQPTTSYLPSSPSDDGEFDSSCDATIEDASDDENGGIVATRSSLDGRSCLDVLSGSTQAICSKHEGTVSGETVGFTSPDVSARRNGTNGASSLALKTPAQGGLDVLTNGLIAGIRDQSAELRTATQMIAKRDYGNAIYHINLEIARVKSSPEKHAVLYALRARCRYELKQYSSMLKDAESSIAADASSLGGNYLVSVALDCLGRYNEVTLMGKKGAQIDLATRLLHNSNITRHTIYRPKVVTSTTAPPPVTVQECSQNAIKLYDSGAFAEALSWCSRGIALHTDDTMRNASSTFVMRGECHLALGDHKNALQDADQALVLKQFWYAKASSLRVRTLVVMGRRDEALETCELALAASPDLLVFIQLRNSLLGQVITINTKPGTPDKRNRVVKEGLAQVAAGKHTDAAHTFTEALSLLVPRNRLRSSMYIVRDVSWS